MSGTPGEVNFNNVCARELIAPSRATSSATGKKVGKNLFFVPGSKIYATKSRVAASHGSLGWIQLVFNFASLSALVM